MHSVYGGTCKLLPEMGAAYFCAEQGQGAVPTEIRF